MENCWPLANALSSSSHEVGCNCGQHLPKPTSRLDNDWNCGRCDMANTEVTSRSPSGRPPFQIPLSTHVRCQKGGNVAYRALGPCRLRHEKDPDAGSKPHRLAVLNSILQRWLVCLVRF